MPRVPHRKSSVWAAGEAENEPLAGVNELAERTGWFKGAARVSRPARADTRVRRYRADYQLTTAAIRSSRPWIMLPGNMYAPADTPGVAVGVNDVVRTEK